MTAGHEPWLEKWRRFRRRPPEDRALILRAALILPLSRIGLRAFGFLRWKGLIEKLSPPPRSTPSLPIDLQWKSALRAVRAVRSAELHGPVRLNCLERSLTLWWLLRWRGVESELQIGARKEGVRLVAHAWIELDGQVLNDGAEVRQHYARFDSPIAAGITEPSDSVKAGLR